MPGSILLTSFATWKPEQPSNSSDDLLGMVAKQRLLSTSSLHFLRQIPVDFQIAPRQVIQRILAIQPAAVVCCGMGESRTTLDLESTAVWGSHTLKTWVDLDWLVDGLPYSQISHDAGQFVCNGLYFDVLDFLNQYPQRPPCIFVHVPRLHYGNKALIMHDFLAVLGKIQQLISSHEKELAMI